MAKKKLPIYELKVSDIKDEIPAVTFTALVDSPAIESNWMYFNKQQFVEPKPGESESDFMGRCIKYVIDEGKPQEQAVAICISKWNGFAAESYSDYPEDVQNNAKKVLDWTEKNGWGSCGTSVGKIRANQLANKEPISVDTIKRMYSYLSRHSVDLESSKSYSDGCGLLMYDSWGGKAGLRWSESKLKELGMLEMSMQFEKVSFDWDGVGSTAEGKAKIQRMIDAGDTVYIITARNSKDGISLDGIPDSRIIATGSNKAKVEKVKELGITSHYDNNPDVVSELGKIGHKFLEQAFSFKVQDAERRIITGAAMIPDLPIYRRDDVHGEYEVVFSKDTIETIVKKWAKSGFYNNVNIMHNPDAQPGGVYLIESFIVDKTRGINAPKVLDDNLPDGSWVQSYYVENDVVWNDIKNGVFKGFSVEGMFDMVDASFKAINIDEKELESIFALLARELK